MKKIRRSLALALAAFLGFLPAAFAGLNPGDLGSTSESGNTDVFGIPSRSAAAARRDTAGNPLPAFPSQDDIYQGSLEQAERNVYDPDSWVSSILRRSADRPNYGYRPSPNQVITPQLYNSERVARTLSARNSPNGQGSSDWADLARVLTQIFNGWDA